MMLAANVALSECDCGVDVLWHSLWDAHSVHMEALKADRRTVVH
jgi:hypothetical protein